MTIIAGFSAKAMVLRQRLCSSRRDPAAVVTASQDTAEEFAEERLRHAKLDIGIFGLSGFDRNIGCSAATPRDDGALNSGGIHGRFFYQNNLTL